MIVIFLIANLAPVVLLNFVSLSTLITIFIEVSFLAHPSAKQFLNIIRLIK